MRRQFNVRLPHGTLEQISTLVETTGLTQTQVVIVAIDRLMNGARKDKPSGGGLGSNRQKRC